MKYKEPLYSYMEVMYDLTMVYGEIYILSRFYCLFYKYILGGTL